MYKIEKISLPYFIGPSKIHGKGILAANIIAPGTIIDLGIGFTYGIFPFVTNHFGSYINHSYTPNAHLVYFDDGWYVVSSYMIKKDEEITVDYNKAPWYIEGALPHYV